MDLIDALVDTQRKAHLDADQMAKELGITRRYYDKLVAGERSPGVQPLAGAIQRFPELWPFVLAFLTRWTRRQVATPSDRTAGDDD